MYIAYGWLEEFIGTNRRELYEKMRQGSTDAHIDISGACNILANVVEPKVELKSTFLKINTGTFFSTPNEAPSSLFTKRQRQSALRNILTEGGVDQAVIEKFCQSDLVAGALWHIWPPRHTAKIRSILKKLDKSNQYKKSSGNDPIHDQDTYITGELREKLEEHDIYAQAIIQCAGDCVFIPQVRNSSEFYSNFMIEVKLLNFQGAVHQVLNINSCVKIAVDFISPQCVRNALETTNELRGLSATHENREDKLQLKAHLYHTGTGADFST